MNERKPMTEQEEKTVTILLAKLGPWLWQLEDDVKDVRSFLESRQKWANWSSLKEDDREKSLSFQIYKIFLEIESGFGFLRDCLMHKQDLPKTASVEDFLAYQRNQWKKFDFPLTELKRFEFFLPHVTVPVQQFENLMPLIKETYDPTSYENQADSIASNFTIEFVVE